MLTDYAAWQDYFELGVILLRKKLFTQATKNLEKAKKTWSGEPDELAQVDSPSDVLSNLAFCVLCAQKLVCSFLYHSLAFMSCCHLNLVHVLAMSLLISP